MSHTSIQAMIPACSTYTKLMFRFQPTFTLYSSTGRTNDYDDTVIFRTILPSTTSRVVSQDIRITNDNINEIEQQFAVVGELGSEVPEEFVCFRVTVGEAECRGRVGTTGIRIRDNDR